MSIPNKDDYRLKDKTQLVLKVNYFASLCSLLFGLICYFFLDITGIIPYTFWGFALLNLINTFLLKSHQRLIHTYNITSILAMVSALIITLFSGGIQSPFIYVLGIVVFAGYVATRVYGRIYLIINLVVVGLIFMHDLSDFNLANDTVPTESKNVPNSSL